MILPAIQAIREGARRAQCKNNLFQIGVGLHNYQDVHRTFPPGYVSALGSAGEDLGPGWGWAAMLLPFLEQSAIWEEIPFESRAGSLACTTVMGFRIELFLCPSDWGARSASVSNYAACFGRGSLDAPDQGDGVFFRNSRVRLRDIDDGALTILVGERSMRQGSLDWAGIFDEAGFTSARTAAIPRSVPDRVLGHTGLAAAVGAISGEAGGGAMGASDRQAHSARLARMTISTCPADFGGIHQQGANFLFVDGAVRFLSEEIDSGVYAALATRAGRELVNETDF